MRPIDFCHPYDLRAPVPRAFLARSAAFAAWTSREVLAPRDMTREEDVSRRPHRFGGSTLDTNSLHLLTRKRVRGRFLPTVPQCDRASDTPVATRLSVPSVYLRRSHSDAR
jgi:hypothetical protein